MQKRIFAVSDIHVDYKSNMEMVKSWNSDYYGDDILILAGDVSDNINLLQETLEHLTASFRKVMFCPGNHELWLKSVERNAGEDSIHKFHKIISLCKRLGVGVYPELISLGDGTDVWIVPLFSWYSEPDDDAADSLYVAGPDAASEEGENDFWMDNHRCSWNSLPAGMTRAKYFANLNIPALERTYDAPVITFSHFLPRRDLVPMTESEKLDIQNERVALGLPTVFASDSKQPPFNFTRFAGSQTLDTQLRKIGSVLHVFGHQHRNKDRMVDGVRYVSHCLGYERERTKGYVTGLSYWMGPKLIWHQNGMVNAL